MGDYRIDIVEGMTCAGKTTCVQDIGAVYDTRLLLEHPPRLDFDPNDWLGHQNAVFEAYLRAFEAVESDCFADFSPLACIPFTMACMDIGLINKEAGLAAVCDMMARCNRLLRQYRIYLHRYFSQPLSTIEKRLSERGRAGDSDWDHDLLVAIKERYDEFFDSEKWLVRRKVGRIVSIHTPPSKDRFSS